MQIFITPSISVESQNHQKPQILKTVNLSSCESMSYIPRIYTTSTSSVCCISWDAKVFGFFFFFPIITSNSHFVSPKTIDLSGCINFADFPQIYGNITMLDLSETPIKEVPSSIECLADLKTLRLSKCTRLKRLFIKH